MSLPKSSSTPRGEYLQSIVAKTRATDLLSWPQPTDDYELLGEFIAVYSFIDFNLRRFMEVLDHADVLPQAWKGKKGEKLPISDVDKVIRAMPGWDQKNILALERIERYRGLRNLLAHFAARRFPNDDAYLFVTKSARDYRQQFGRDSRPGKP